MRGPADDYHMRITSGVSSVPPMQVGPTDAMRAQHQVKVLKKALDSQTQAADQLLKMLEPKGKIVDIRA